MFCLHKHRGIKLATFVQMRNLSWALKPDIVHTHQIGTLFYAGPAVASLGRTAQTRVVHTEHGREPYMGSAAVAGLVGLHANRFFCLSHDMAAALIKHKIVPRWKVQVVDNGIDVDRLGSEASRTRVLRRSLGISPDSPVIGNVGRLVDVEWHDVLIQSFAELRCAVPGAHLVIVGDGPLKNELLDLIGQLDVGVESPSCRLSSRSLEIPVRHGLLRMTSRSEGMPQAVLEAAVAGLPRSSRRGWEACPRSSRTAGRAS